MDVVGSEIGQKMRSAIKAKLTELGCYVDDELPDYVMVMVANKRTRAQMEDDLQLFLGDNTESFVNWLHQVLKKLQEVTVTPLKTAAVDPEPPKEKSKEKKSKDKKEKSKKSDSSKKSKKKEKEKSRKKIEKKLHKSKKKSKHHDMIRPNIPPLLMNMEKDSEPSITDVFAGQILKNHGITIDNVSKGEVTKIIDVKPAVEEIEVKRPILPIIDPATIENPEGSDFNNAEPANVATVTPTVAAQDPVKEMNEIEAKIQGLKQKLAEQLDSMSDDEDFLNIRTEAEELMNDFADDVVQEISQPPPATPVVANNRSPSPIREIADSPTFDAPKELEAPKEIVKEPIEELPQIELKLPKRPVRERLGERREETKPQSKGSDKPESPERFTPEKEPEKPQKSAKSRLGDPPEISRRRSSSSDDSESKPSFKKVTSKVSVKESLPSRACASVVRVRPRPRVSAPSLLLKAVADAHKSLLNIPPKTELESKPKRALVLPMRRTVDAKQIVIQVPQDKHDKVTTESPKEEYIPAPLTMKFNNTEYVPSRRNEARLDTRYESRHDARVTTRRDDSLVIETLNIHNTTVDKDKNTQFIVTMDGFNPNAFLAKKLLTEGILDEDEVKIGKKSEASSVLKIVSDQENTLKSNSEKQDSNTEEIVESIRSESPKDILDITTSHDIENVQSTSLLKKRLSDTSDDSETRVIIKMEEEVDKLEKKRKAVDKVKEDTPAKRRKASPIVFDINRHEKEISRLKETEIVKEKEKEKADKERKRTDSTSSENHVTIATNVNTHKYDALPSLSSAAIVADRKPRCRVFPHCRFGAACAFQHPPCKYSAGCSRRDCVYAHPNRPAPVVPSVASHVVPSSNYKTITPHSPTMCKFFPQCVNPTCHFYHPKPCRYGKACSNKPHCNFYHV